MRTANGFRPHRQLAADFWENLVVSLIEIVAPGPALMNGLHCAGFDYRANAEPNPLTAGDDPDQLRMPAFAEQRAGLAGGRHGR